MLVADRPSYIGPPRMSDETAEAIAPVLVLAVGGGAALVGAAAAVVLWREHSRGRPGARRWALVSAAVAAVAVAAAVAVVATGGGDLDGPVWPFALVYVAAASSLMPAALLKQVGRQRERERRREAEENEEVQQ